MVTDEIGDTWIHGCPSDPVKVTRYREMARLRREWIADGHIAVGDATDLGFLRKFALSAEHTWGTDTKTYLDHDHYKPADLEDVFDKSGYQKMMTSWAEKRRNIDEAVASLPVPMKAQAVGRLAKLKPVVPGTEGLNVFKPAKDFETTHFTVGIDDKTGAIRKLSRNGREWASAEHPLALFSYQTRFRRTITRSSWRAM